MKIIFLLSLILGFAFSFLLFKQNTGFKNPVINTLSDKEVVISPKSKVEVKEKIELTGWFTYYDEERSYMSLPYVLPYLQLFSPALYEVSSTGDLKKITVKNKSNILNDARKHELKIFPVVNDGGEKRRLKLLFENEDLREVFVESLINEAKLEGFSGFAIDFENLESKDKNDFINLSKLFFEKLHLNNLEFHNILFGREKNETYDPALAHPYTELGKYADRIYLMVYNYNNSYTAPGGQTPVEWYKKVLDYAVESIPKNKIVIGLSTHGYQWQGNKITGLTFPQIKNLIDVENARISFDSTQSAKLAQIGNSKIYYEDWESTIHKIGIACNEFGLAKFALWRIGAEDPRIWSSLGTCPTP